MTVCEICHNSAAHQFSIVREIMFGRGEEFEYFECGECGCLQIPGIPYNISRSYPKNYYSFRPRINPRESVIERFLKRLRMKCLVCGNSTVGIGVSKILSKLYGTAFPHYCHWFRRIKLPLDSEILDVGCGSGKLLLDMRAEGFTNLTGADPFIKEDILYSCGVKIFKKELSALDKPFDFIMLNHSFEHMPEPLSVLEQVYRLLKPNRYALIRIPVLSCFAWQKYGAKWVQIDAPRPFFFHTPKSLQIVAKKAGFEVADIFYDSPAYQFWGSEQLLRDIPVRDSRSYAVNSEKSIFTKDQRKSFHERSVQLNREKDGRAAGFYLYKA